MCVSAEVVSKLNDVSMYVCVFAARISAETSRDAPQKRLWQSVVVMLGMCIRRKIYCRDAAPQKSSWQSVI